MTDAAMAERAECVMLSKGCYVVDARAILEHFLSRMELALLTLYTIITRPMRDIEFVVRSVQHASCRAAGCVAPRDRRARASATRSRAAVAMT